MNIEIKVVPRARNDMIKKSVNGLKVYLTAPAVDGKANLALVRNLAEYFEVRRSQVKIIKGLKSRTKIVNIVVKNLES